MFQIALLSYGPGLITALVVAGTQAFGAESDPLSEQPQITATQLVEWVLSRNPELKAQQAALEAAEYRIAPAGALDDPRLTYANAPSTLGGTHRLSQQLELSQALPWPGKLALRKQVAEEKARATAEDRETLRLQVVAATKILFAEWFYIHRALAINRDHQALLEELQRIAEIQYAAGRAGQPGALQDALQAEVARTRLEAETVTLARRRREIQARMNALLSRPPQQAVPRPAHLPPPAKLPSLERLQQQALQYHPALSRLQARLAAAKAQTRLAKKAYYPDFQIIGSYNSFWDEPDKRLTVGLSINLPLDYGNKRESALSAARADLRQVQWQLTDQEAQMLSELEASRAAVQEAEEVIHLYIHRLVPLAQDNLNAALADYRAGVGPFITVIDAERQQLRTEDELAQARANYLRQLAELARWIGVPPDRLADPILAPAAPLPPTEESTP